MRSSDFLEIPCVRGLPVPFSGDEGLTIVREWPNLAGRCEPFGSDDVVRWDRSLAPRPDTEHVLSQNPHAVDDIPVGDEILHWFRVFVRSLEQMPGVLAATPFESTCCILFTPWNVSSEPPATFPHGLTLVPRRLREFPGGVAVALNADRWQQRDEYASTMRDWFAQRAEHHKATEHRA